jgi:hypothetical protein
MATNAQLDARLRIVENWKTATIKGLADFEIRLRALEAAPAGTDYSAAIAALQKEVDALKLLTCPEAPRLDAIDAALALLAGDHVPEV